MPASHRPSEPETFNEQFYLTSSSRVLFQFTITVVDDGEKEVIRRRAFFPIALGGGAFQVGKR